MQGYCVLDLLLMRGSVVVFPTFHLRYIVYRYCMPPLYTIRRLCKQQNIRYGSK